MAHIYEAPNENEIKVRDYIENELHRARQRYERNEDHRNRTLIFCGVVIAVSAGFLLALIFWPGLLAGIQDWVVQLLQGWSNGLMSSELDLTSEDNHFLWNLILALASLLLRLVLGLLGMLVFLISYIAPLVTAVVLFAGLGLVLWCCVAVLSYTLQPFDPEWQRSYIADHLPEELQILKAGIAGESRALDLVRQMDSQCHIFSNLDINFGGNHNETDLIAVTPSGITVVEVKNYSGHIQGDLSDEELIQVKHSRKGNPYNDTCRNPVVQIEAPVNRLNKYLRSQGIRLPIRRCALFINDNVHLEVTDRQGMAATCPLFTYGAPAFTRYLHDPSSRNLSQREIERVVAALSAFL